MLAKGSVRTNIMTVVLMFFPVLISVTALCLVQGGGEARLPCNKLLLPPSELWHQNPSDKMAISWLILK
jgi:hypothetical protein